MSGTAIIKFLSFPSSCLCEHSFSGIISIEMKNRNITDPKLCLMPAENNTQPKIYGLNERKIAQFIRLK